MKSRLRLLPDDILDYIYKLSHEMNTDSVIFEFNRKITNSKYYHVLWQFGPRIKLYPASDMGNYTSELDFIHSRFRFPSKFKYM